MNLDLLAEMLWGKKARLRYLLVGAAFLLFALLDMRDLWTQEHRWAEIVETMFSRHDFLHPYLDGQIYYDKPLLSYWLIAAIAKGMGTLNTWALRLPSALAGLIALWSIYQIGLKQKKQRVRIIISLVATDHFLFCFLGAY